MAEGVSIEEGDSPVEETNDAAEQAEAAGAEHVAGLLALLAGD